MDTFLMIVTPGGIQLKVITLPRLAHPYPPALTFMADNRDIENEWKDFLKKNALSDDRENNGNHYEVEVLDNNKLQYIVKEHEQVIFVDADTGEIVGGAIEDIIEDDDIRMVLNGTITEYLNNVRTSIRKNDPGFMASVGYTSGARNSRSLQWAKNLKAKVNVSTQAYKISCAYAHLYSELKPYLPKDVIDDFDQAKVKLDGLTMDAGTREGENMTMKYNMNVRGEDRTYETTEFAPPTGQCTLNYCRFTHNETNLNKYCFAYNTLRTHSEDHGGNFYVAEYGIFIPNRANQMKIWQGGLWHGTTLALVDPTDKTPDLRTIGVSFILPTSIKTEVDREKSNQVTGPKIAKPAPDANVMLADPATAPIDRATLPFRPRKESATQKKRQKDRKWIILLPEQHAYKDMKLPALLAECARRVAAGTLAKYAKSVRKDFLIKTLLENDGIEVGMQEITEEDAVPEDVLAEEDMLAGGDDFPGDED